MRCEVLHINEGVASVRRASSGRRRYRDERLPCARSARRAARARGCRWLAEYGTGVGRPSRLYVSAELLGLTGSNRLRG
jgi:hypothetical protein